MDFSKLGQNEKLAVYGAAGVIIGGLVGIGAAGLGIVAVLAAIGMLAVVFLPQMSAGTNLPGSKGSLMLVLGAIAAIILVLGLLTVLTALGFMLNFAPIATIFYLIAVAGGILMGWAGWQEFQSEGGKFQLGAATGASHAAPPPASTEAPPAAATSDTAAPPPASTADTTQHSDRPAADPEDRSTV